MREIKFRGILIDTDEWVYGYYYKGITEEIPLCLGDCAVRHVIIADGTMWHVKPETVSQFTGLNDKNGIEIYETDILKWKCTKSGSDKEDDYTVVLKFGSHHYELTIYDDDEKFATGRSLWNEEYREIIGNIHQHPELLEVK